MLFTVNDLLARPYFNKAKLLTGKSNLHSKIKWIHVVEVVNTGHLLNGGEVILTTGSVWADSTEKGKQFLQELLTYHAAALCVEIGTQVTSIPEELLELAEKEDFPVIMFPEEVSFVNIMRDLHEILLGYRESNWQSLEHLYDKLKRVLLANEGIGSFLKVLYQNVQKQIILEYNDQIRFFPSPSHKEKIRIEQHIHNQENKYHFQDVYFLNQEIARLYIVDTEVSELDVLSLKRCSEFLEQYFWKFHHQSEWNEIKKNEWVIGAVTNQLSDRTIKNHIRDKGFIVGDCMVAILSYDEGVLYEKELSKTEATKLMLLKDIFRMNEIEIISCRHVDEEQYILLLVNQRKDNRFHDQLTTAYGQVKDNDFLKNRVATINFGKVVRAAEELPVSYQTAHETLYFQQHVRKMKLPFYQHLSVYRLIHQFKSLQEARNIVDDYIGGLIAHDQHHNTELLKTLKVYYDKANRKSETAKALHVVRQTLYQRLDRINEILSDTSIDATDYFMIYFSLQIYEAMQQYDMIE